MLNSISNRYGIETSICIESNSNPNMARILVKYGIKNISYKLDVILQYEKLYIKRKNKKILLPELLFEYSLSVNEKRNEVTDKSFIIH